MNLKDFKITEERGVTAINPNLFRKWPCTLCGKEKKNLVSLCLECFNKEHFKNCVGTDYLIIFNDEKCTGSWKYTSYQDYNYAYLFFKEDFLNKYSSFKYSLGPCTKENYYKEAHQKARQIIKSGEFARQKLAQRMK